MRQALRIAVVGGGISGLLTARLLGARHDVDLYEAGPELGGHTCTIPVHCDGSVHPVDVGFMVYNRRTYPLFWRLLDRLCVSGRPSQMSFSVECERSGIAYQGSGWNGLLARRMNAIRPPFYRMLLDILRFHRLVPRTLVSSQDSADAPQETLQQFLQRERFSTAFRDLYLLPMAASIWSAKQTDVLIMPARFLIQFFHNHGLAQIGDRPTWHTVVGGARTYIDRLLDGNLFRYRVNCPVEWITRSAQGVDLGAGGLQVQYDHVVLGLHADQALRILRDPRPEEQQVLGAYRYQENEVVLHQDVTQLPATRRAWASWNYRVPADRGLPPTVTYWLNSLQGHVTKQPLLVTLNPVRQIDALRVIRRISFRHPVFDLESWTAQQQLSRIQGVNRTYYCGAYWGNGFHEDGVRSAVEVAKEFGLDWEACIAASTKDMSGIGAAAP